MKSRGQLRDGQPDAGALHVGVAQSAGPNEIGASHFAPNHVVGVIDDSHLIGLGVPNAELDVVVQRLERRRAGVDSSLGQVRRRSFVCKARRPPVEFARAEHAVLHPVRCAYRFRPR